MKKAITFLLALFLAAPLFSNTYAATGIYDKVWDFQNNKVGDYMSGDFIASRNKWYAVAESSNGNKYLEAKAGQHTDYFENVQPLTDEMSDFSVQLRVKPKSYKDATYGQLAFFVRSQNPSNGYYVSMFPDKIEFTDSDMTEPDYADLQYNRKAVASSPKNFEIDKWFQINLVSTTVSPFVQTAEGIFGKVKFEIFLNGVLIITWVDERTWFEGGGFFFYAWDINCYVDDIKISNDINKYRPTGPITLVQDPVAGVSSILSSIIANSSSNGTTTKSSVGVTTSQSGNTNSLQSDAITGTSEQNDSGLNSSSIISTASGTNNPKAPNKGLPLNIIILIIAIVLILGAGGAIYFFVLRKPKV